ncbi:hypothetical protein Sjap_022157 [Stephania japonica]|uniref:Uncharacterized protein n=1 Tax=Stephania japonica TaxID=461633 RepID=A0AAP0HUS1_9MAGN
MRLQSGELQKIPMLMATVGGLETLILDDTFASQMQQLLGNMLQEKDLEPPRSVMEVRSVLYTRPQFLVLASRPQIGTRQASFVLGDWDKKLSIIHSEVNQMTNGACTTSRISFTWKKSNVA